MKKTASTKSTFTRAVATPISAAQLAALQALPDSQIDYLDIPKSLASELANGTVGRFYRPIKKPIYTNVDADVLAWLKSTGVVIKRVSTKSYDKPCCWGCRRVALKPLGQLFSFLK
jgi:uncharacterized protein (DUF4415 family)